MALERISNLDVGAPPIPPLSLIEVSVAVGSPPTSYASRQFTVAELFSSLLPLTEDGAGGLILDNPAGALTETYFGVTNGAVTTYVGSIDGQSGYLSTYGVPLVLQSDVEIQMTGALNILLTGSVTPTANSFLVLQATSDTSLTFKYKGSDGAVRSASLTLS